MAKYFTIKALTPENQLRIECPIFGVEVEVKGCFKLRELYMKGQAPADKRRGCQACMKSSLCPTQHMMREIQVEEDGDRYFSPEPKVGRLSQKVLDRISRLLVLDNAFQQYGVPAGEKSRILAFCAGHKPVKGGTVDEIKSERKKAARGAGAHVKPTSDTIEAAVSGDMAAAVSRAVTKSTEKASPPAAPAKGLSLLELARMKKEAPMKGHDVLATLQDIASTGSRSEKEGIIESAAADPLFRKVLRYAYDPFITFGLTPPKCVGGGKQELHVDHVVWSVLDRLSRRELTGNEALEVVKEWMLEHLDEPSSEVLWRVLSKDLRCGITEKTVNKAISGLVPVFTCMLAHPFEEKRVKSWPVIVEPKLDGVRVLCLVRDGRAKFFSRSGKPFTSFDHLEPVVVSRVMEAKARFRNPANDMTDKQREIYWKLLGGNNCPMGEAVLDGEVVSGIFNETVSAVRKKDVAAVDAEFRVFDVLPYKLFMAENRPEIAMTYEQRRRFAEQVIGRDNGSVRMIERYLANSADEVQALYQSFRDRGLEGAIVKPRDGFYQKKRSFNWLKMKNEATVDVPILDAFEGTGKYEGMLGGVVVLYGGVLVRVGGGFSDRSRQEFWDAFQRDKAKILGDEDAGRLRRAGCELLGRLIEVEYHEETPDGSLRHPRFVRFRDDKAGEKEAA